MYWQLADPQVPFNSFLLELWSASKSIIDYEFIPVHTY